MNKATLVFVHVIIGGISVSTLVCFDPLISYYLGFDRFPYFLSMVMAATLLAGIVLTIGLPKLYTLKDTALLIFIIGMAQFSGIGFGSVDILDVAICFLTALWLLFAFVETDKAIQVSPLMFGIMGLMFLAILALINFPPISGFIAIAEKFVLFFILVALIHRRSLVKFTAYILIWTSLFSSAVAITQAVVFWGWGILWTTGTVGEAVSHLKPTPFGFMPRVTAFFPNPAGLNDYLLFTTSLVLFALASVNASRLKSLLLITFVMNCAAITLTWSASSLSGLALVLFLFCYINRPSLSIHYTAVIVFVGLLCYWTDLLELMFLWMKNYASSSGEIRLRLMELAMDSINRNPFIGLGVQNFANASGNFFQEGVFIFSYPVHNVFGQMATELGVFGALIYLLMVMFIMARIIRIIRIPNLEEQWIFKGQLLGFIPIIIHMFSEPMAYEGTLWLFIGIIEGSAMVMLKSSSSQTEKKELLLPV